MQNNVIKYSAGIEQSIADKLEKHTGYKAMAYPPKGLRNNIAIDLRNDENVLMGFITLTVSFDRILMYDTGRIIWKFPHGSIGDDNGLGLDTKPLPNSINAIWNIMRCNRSVEYSIKFHSVSDNIDYVTVALPKDIYQEDKIYADVLINSTKDFAYVIQEQNGSEVYRLKNNRRISSGSMKKYNFNGNEIVNYARGILSELKETAKKEEKMKREPISVKRLYEYFGVDLCYANIITDIQNDICSYSLADKDSRKYLCADNEICLLIEFDNGDYIYENRNDDIMMPFKLTAEEHYIATTNSKKLFKCNKEKI